MWGRLPRRHRAGPSASLDAERDESRAGANSSGSRACAPGARPAAEAVARGSDAGAPQGRTRPRDAGQLGCCTIRMYGLGDSQPSGQISRASSSETEPAMIDVLAVAAS